MGFWILRFWRGRFVFDLFFFFEKNIPLYFFYLIYIFLGLSCFKYERR